MRARLVLALVALAAPRVVLGDEDPRLAKGKQLFGELNPRCTVCHALGDKGNLKGPPLDDVGNRWKSEELKAWLRTPADMAKKHGKLRRPPMVPYPELEDEELADLVAYLATLKKP